MERKCASASTTAARPSLLWVLFPTCDRREWEFVLAPLSLRTNRLSKTGSGNYGRPAKLAFRRHFPPLCSASFVFGAVIFFILCNFLCNPQPPRHFLRLDVAAIRLG